MDGPVKIYNFPNRIRAYSREVAVSLGKKRRKCWTFTNPRGETHLYALYSGPKGVERTIVTLAYLHPKVGWVKDNTHFHSA